MKTTVALALLLLGLLASQARAVIIYGPNGYGGINAYELVGAGQNWSGAKTASQIAFPGGPGIAGSSVIGHLGTIRNATENLTFGRMTAGDPWIGLTDQAGDAPGAFEGGNQTNWPLPAVGNTPTATERGYGWAWVTGEPLILHNWNGAGEPNGNTGESHAHLTGGTNWNDLVGTSSRAYIREWDLNLASLPTPKFAPDTPGLLMTDLRNVGTVTNANFKTLATSPPTNSIASFSLVPTINFASSGGTSEIGGDQAFPQGTGDHFVARFTGFIEIPTTGTYTFKMRQDDQIYLKIGAFETGAFVFEDTACCDTTLTTMVLNAGRLPIDVIFGEMTGGESIELSAAFGNFLNDPGNPAFRLVGDTANGGLAVFAAITPEPASIAMWLVIGVGLAAFGYRRFRRAAK